MKFSKILQTIVIMAILAITITSILFNLYISIRHPVLLRNFLFRISALMSRPGKAVVADRAHKSIAYYAYLLKMENVQAVDSDNGTVLPDSLIIPKGIYRYGKDNYRLDREGVWRFVNPSIGNEQRIVYEKEMRALLSGLCWVMAHGKRDNGRPSSELSEIAKRSKVILVCGNAASWVKEILAEQKIDSRMVMARAPDNENDHVSKHVFLEVYDKDALQWLLYDMDNNAIFKSKDRYLSFYDFIALSQSGEYEIEYIAKDYNLDISGFKGASTEYDFALFFEGLILSDGSLRKWYKTLMERPYIYSSEEKAYLDPRNSYEKFYK